MSCLTFVSKNDNIVLKKGSDIMKNWKYILLIAIIILSTVALLIFSNNKSAKADNTVDIAYFNEVIDNINTTTDELNIKITELNTKIDTLITENTVLKQDIKALKLKDNENTSLVNSVISRTTKIEKWNKALYTALIENYNRYGIAAYMTQFERNYK